MRARLHRRSFLRRKTLHSNGAGFLKIPNFLFWLRLLVHTCSSIGVTWCAIACISRDIHSGRVPDYTHERFCAGKHDVKPVQAFQKSQISFFGSYLQLHGRDVVRDRLQIEKDHSPI
jgi:hypothetical protein